MTLEPQPFNRLNFSHKFNGPAVRYEVAISILGGDICWVNGPFRPGANPDAVIFSSGLRHQLDEGERVEADNGYISLDPQYCKCPKGYRHLSEENSRGSRRARARHETANSRLKAFDVLKCFRHEVMKHGEVFRAVALIVQVSIEVDSPLFEVNETHYNDEENENNYNNE